MSMIAQAELKEFLKLKEKLMQIEKEVAAKRRELLEKLEANALVESGPLSAQVRVVTQRLLNGETLIPLLGKAKVEDLKALVTPNVQRHLIVQPRPALAHKKVTETSPHWDGEFEG